MSNLGLFAAGTVVTLLVFGALALLVWGAILDGRYDDEQRTASAAEPPRARQNAAVPTVDRSASL